LQGSAATDMRRGGGFNSSFLHKSQILSEFNSKKYEYCFTFAEVVVKIKVVSETWCTIFPA